MTDQELIHAYADGELSGQELAAFEQQLKSEPKLRERVESTRQLKLSIARNVASFDVDEAWAGCADRIAELNKKQKTERFVTRNAWAICGSFALVIAVGGFFHRLNAPTTVENADFVKLVAGGAGVRSQPISPERKQLNNFLDGLLNEARKVSTDNRIMVLAAAEGNLGSQRATRLSLQDQAGDLALIVTENIVAVQGLSTETSYPGYGFGMLGNANCVQWNYDGHTFLLAGNRNPGDLVAVAKQISNR